MSEDEERTERMKPILDRIPQEWGKWLPDAGWDQLLLDLDRAISAVNPDYEIHQVKEKFGTLRFYVEWNPDLPERENDLIKDLVYRAEAQSAHICEKCGATGAKARHTGWIKTLCDECFANPRRRVGS